MSVFLHLFHGRNDIAEDMDDWGFDGPHIGPLKYVHTTYACDIKFSASQVVMDKFFPGEVAYFYNGNGDHHLTIEDGCIIYQGKFYGDWSVHANHDEAMKNNIALDRVKAHEEV